MEAQNAWLGGDQTRLLRSMPGSCTILELVAWTRAKLRLRCKMPRLRGLYQALVLTFCSDFV